MKRTLILIAVLVPLTMYAQEQTQKPTTLKGVLLEQLRTTHNVKDWYVPVLVAVDGVTPEQASWTDGKGNHSVGQLTYHLLFWDRYALAEFKGEKPEKFSGNNDETFNNFEAKQWADTVHQLDQILTEWEKAVETADDAKLAKNASLIAHVGAHNAYHIGEIVMVRKEQGSWDASKGVK
ncbi:MAG TPA: DinB family protein [Terriglobales bacterium]|nr:DinB family protein [Terriglobales bacterium]